MNTPVEEIQSALFEGISVQDRRALLGCMGYRVRTFPKGSFVAMEDEKINQIGIILSGTVDMVKEDLWGNRTMLLRMKKNEVFGETFACGDHGNSTVTFVASQTAEILFLPFCRVTRCCTNSCEFHHRLSDNLVGIMANKNRELMRKVEVVTKRTTREKLLAYLSIQGQLQGSSTVDLPLSRVELAEYLCVDRSAMTRELMKMQQDGLIAYEKNRFKLL
jgi:CRP-like cAMP-binding protein